MTNKHAQQEYSEISKIKKLLSKVPNNKNYFVLSDVSTCKPEPLTDNDLKKYVSTCTALPKDDIEINNINLSLNKLTIIQMPDGGLPVDDYITKNINFKKLSKLMISLQDLFLNGILPMNNINVFHSDIKDSNILVDDKNDIVYTRLIDWGLSCYYVPNKTMKIPSVWTNRPFQYNIPWSIILFSDMFIDNFNNLLVMHNNISDKMTEHFTKLFIENWIEVRGRGHLFLINKIINVLTDEKPTKESIDKNLNPTKPNLSKNTENFIIGYITQIVQYVIDNIRYNSNVFKTSSDILIYLNTIFIENIDVWGYVSTYYPLLMLFYDNYLHLSDVEIAIFNYLKQIFLVTYSAATVEIDKNDITKNINNIISLFNSNVPNNNNHSHSLSPSQHVTSSGITGFTFNPAKQLQFSM